MSKAPTPITSPALPPSVPEESETVKEKEQELIDEIQRRFREFIGKEVNPDITTKVCGILHDSLQRWVDGQPKWSDLYDVRVVDGGDNKITITLFDKLGRQLSFEDGNPIVPAAGSPPIEEVQDTCGFCGGYLTGICDSCQHVEHTNPRKKTMTEELKDNPIDCHDQADAEAKDLIAVSPKLKCLMWDDGGELPVEYLYMNAAGVMVVCKAFVERIDKWFEPLIDAINEDSYNFKDLEEENLSARGLCEYLFPGCEFEEKAKK